MRCKHLHTHIPDGTAGHGSTVSFAQIVAGAEPVVQTLENSGLPFASLAFVSDNAVVAAGWDCNPTLFTATGDAADPTWYALSPRRCSPTDNVKGQDQGAGCQGGQELCP